MSFLVILYLYDMLHKTYVKSFFEIPIKTFIIKVLLGKRFWLKEKPSMNLKEKPKISNITIREQTQDQ